ncbi:hypothetical protein ACT7SZ_001512 [Vibrio cholerae]|uniref:lysozyme n=1 Tax=Vibrio cholerae TaxID=666 RepID=UPI0011BD4A9C|nr:lysozyme [Vibrio cholerae]
MALLKEIEELRLIPYDDQTGKSISSYVEGATIGYGYLIPKNEWSIYKNGITKEIAEELFLRKVPRFQENVQSKLKLISTKINSMHWFCFVITLERVTLIHHQF